MGWTCMEKPADVRATLARNLTWESKHAAHRVIRDAFVGMTYYAAVETIEKATGKRTVWAAVTLIRYHPTRWRGGVEMCVKEMDETVGPVESKCPKTILALLTPLENDTNGWAAGWRERCKRWHEMRSKEVKREDLIRWAASVGRSSAIFDGMAPAMYRRWVNAYRRHHYAQESR